VAQKKKKRSTKHRGNAAGMVEARGRTGRASAGSAKVPMTASERRAARLDRPPSWSSAITRAGITAALFAVVLIVFLKHKPSAAITLSSFMFVLYIPLGYLTDSFVYKRRMKKQGRPVS